MSKLLLLFSTAALAVASAASNDHKVTISSPTWVGPAQLDAGQYRVQVEGDKAVFRSGNKLVAEAPVKVETNAQKYSVTSLSIGKEDNKATLKEIRVGGTRMRIVIEEASE